MELAVQMKWEFRRRRKSFSHFEIAHVVPVAQ